jgi:hypothetical protein
MNRFNQTARPQRSAASRNATAVKTIPFDYAFQFALSGTRGNKVQDVVEISTEGIFVALSVGYSLVLDEQRTPRTFPPVIDQRTTPQAPVAIPFFVSPENTDFAGFIVAGMPGAEIAILGLETEEILRTARIQASGTTTVELGPDLPDSLRAWDRTNSLLGEIFEIGPPMTPVIGINPSSGRLPAAGDRTVFVYGSAEDDISYDLFLFKSTSQPGRATKLNSNGIFLNSAVTLGRQTFRQSVSFETALSPGDALLISDNPDVDVDPFSMFTIPRPRPSTISLGALAAGLERIGADLTRGFRLNPNFAALFAADLPLDQIAQARFERAFETGSLAAEEVSFLYSLDVGNTGREYQSEPIHNIAGLGIANGDRPFRSFSKPIMFDPRSFIRIQVEELAGPPGTLFIVLQGYKMLGTSRIPG